MPFNASKQYRQKKPLFSHKARSSLADSLLGNLFKANARFLSQYWERFNKSEFKKVITLRKSPQESVRYLSHSMGMIFLGKVPIHKLSPHSILIEGQSFEKSIRNALNFFKVKNKENLIWKKIYYQKPSQETDDKVDAYKFFYHPNVNEILDYLVDQNQEKNYLNYEVKKTRDGVYIKFIQEISNALINTELIKRKLKSLNVHPTPQLIKECLDSKRNWVRLRDINDKEDVGEDGRVTITVSEDSLKAYATKTRNTQLGRKVDVQDVMSELKKNLISFGILRKRIDDFVRNNIYDQPVLIVDCDCDNPNFSSTYTEEYLALSDLVASNNKKESLFFIINKDDLILKRKIPEKNDYLFFNIYGKVYKKLKKLELLKAGPNTYFDYEGNLRAGISGTLFAENNAYDVHKILSIASINSRTPKINHNGSIIVERDVEDGVSVKVTGSIFIKGFLGAAQLEAGGNIVINKGVNGAHRAFLRSRGGSIVSEYIRNSTIHCKKNLIVNSFLNDCKAWVGGSVIADEPKATVLGGNYYIHKTLITYNLGSVSGWKTYAHLGVPTELIYSLEEAKGKLEALENENREKKTLLENTLDLPSEETGRLKKEFLTNENAIISIKEKIKDLESQRFDIYEKAEVMVKQDLHPGVVLEIGNILWENKYLRVGVSLVVKGDSQKNIFMSKL